SDAKDFTEADVPRLTAWAALPQVVALGEIGLDYHYDFSPRDAQRQAFLRQLALAHALDMPVILHVREAHGDVIDLLRARRDSLPPFVVHCYSGSWESAKIYLDMGAMLSLAGPVTFKKSANLQDVARRVPTDRLLVETDSPYLAPEPMRGRRNDPRSVAHIARFVADLRGMPAETLAQATWRNAHRFYRIAE
ncbi:MAG: TatD family hydrolase, partial [Oscillospiraceae bacterium]|nr:TatD family hydrolase [Oscillospiraceae bacterium]